MDATEIASRTLFDAEMDCPEPATAGPGEAALFSRRAPEREGANEDALALLSLAGRRALILLADGFGGHPSGQEAAALAIEAVADSVTEAVTAADPEGSDGLAAAILAGFDAANAAVMGLGVGAATTLVAVELWEDWIRPYHVGDSEVIVMGQRGKLKLQTTPHSPVGYAVEAGMVNAEDALHHDERHLVSNMVGSPEMRLEVGAPLRLGRLDTVVVGSDGLFDNLTIEEIVALGRKGPLVAAAAALAHSARKRMVQPPPHKPSKPDDLSFAVYRLARSGRQA